MIYRLVATWSERVMLDMRWQALSYGFVWWGWRASGKGKSSPL